MVWKGRLPGRDHVRVACFQGEAVAPVLQRHTVSGQDQARAKAHVIALDEADHHATLVGRGQVDGAALDRVAALEILGTIRVDQGRAAGQVLLVQQLSRGELHAARVGDITVHIGEGQLHGLDLQMLAGHTVQPHDGGDRGA